MKCKICGYDSDEESRDDETVEGRKKGGTYIEHCNLVSKFIVTSDQHLGYKNSDSISFRAFLDYICNRSDVDAVILLGDLVDMWRRDVSGLFLTFSNVVNKLLDIKSSGKEVYFIAAK